MEFMTLAIFVTALLLNAGTPGPRWVGEVLWLTMAMAGLTALAHTFQIGMQIIKWLGIGYLCWLAYKMWRQSSGIGEDEIPQRASALSMFSAGLAITLGNPKIIVFYLALLPSLVDLSTAGISEWLVLAFATLVTLSAIDLSWTFMAHKARSFIHTPKARILTNRMGAMTLAGAALAIAAKS